MKGSKMNAADRIKWVRDSEIAFSAQALVAKGIPESTARVIAFKTHMHDELVATLRNLVERCDGSEGVREDGSNIDTLAAHAMLLQIEAHAMIEGK
jgi:hypothetical protein